eukprot:4997979-Prymnesium_polylepis.1
MLRCLSVQAHARSKLYKKAEPNKIDEFYSTCLGLRSEPFAACLKRSPSAWVLPITSVSEDKFLRELGLTAAERNQIEGLHSARSSTTEGLTQQQQARLALVKLAADPPVKVGEMQRITAAWLLRPFPHGLRFSGKNMSPLPCWLAGAQNVCLNFSDNDIAVQLHFALFRGSEGFILKPAGMVGEQLESAQRQNVEKEPPFLGSKPSLIGSKRRSSESGSCLSLRRRSTG